MVARLKTTIFGSRSQEWEYFKAGIKHSIAPAALVCLIASNTFLHHFGTLAYIPAVSAGSFTPLQPRAKLVWYHAQTALLFAISYAYSLLAGWSGVRARSHTTPHYSTSDPGPKYNGSSAAVVAIFFAFYYWAIFSLKSAHLAWKLPGVVAGLYIAATLPGIAAAGSMKEVLHIANLTIEAFLAGQAFALIVGLVILPVTCRKSFLQSVRDGLHAVVSLEKTHSSLIALAMSTDDVESVADEEGRLISQLRASLQAFLAKAGQSRADLRLAKQEVAYARMDGAMLDELLQHVARLVPLLSGIVSVAEMLHTARQSAIRLKDLSQEAVPEWEEFRLEMRTRTKRRCDGIASSAEVIWKQLEPGSFRHPRSRAGIPDPEKEPASAATNGEDEKDQAADAAKLTSDQFKSEFKHARSMMKNDLTPEQQQAQAVHYFMVINEQRVLSATLCEIQELASFVESVHNTPRRFIAPSWDSIQLHLRDLFGFTDDTKFTSPKWHKSTPTLRIRLANFSQLLNTMLYSQHAGFGLRGAFAMMSIGIIAFLPSSAAFYAAQRFLWILYAILLSLNETAGASTQSLCARFLGTVCSMLASYCIWYIPDQKTPGILVFFWIWFMVLGYLYARAPLIQQAWWIASFAAIVMVGNELQVRRLGAVAVHKAGQAVYKPYVLFPYRMGIVTLGIVVAYFWTIFPKPLTEHQELERCISTTLSCMAKFNLVVQQIVKKQVFQSREFHDGRYSKEQLWEAGRFHLARYQQNSSNARTITRLLGWEISLKPSFTKSSATNVLDLAEKIVNQMSLIEVIALSISRSESDQGSGPTLDEDETSLYPHLVPQGITNRLVDISNALSKGHLLAPDLEVLNLPHISYFLDLECPEGSLLADAALIHAANYYIIKEVNELTSLVVEVVGTLDFA